LYQVAPPHTPAGHKQAATPIYEDMKERDPEKFELIKGYCRERNKVCGWAELVDAHS
jgi:hypothetical protein